MPEELRARPQWVIWRYGPPRKDGKRPKLPYCPHTFDKADVTNPATWGTFAQAAAAQASNRYFDGIGYVFAEDDPFTGVDLDGCMDAAGQLDPQAAALLRQLPGAYVELSPSGTGVHAIVRAQLPGPGRRRGQLECYDRARYFTITGRAMSAPGPIADAQAAIAALYTELGGDTAGDTAAPLAPEALDWGFFTWLEANMRRLIAPNGLPFGATPQLRDLLLRGQLPARLAATDSERRALVVAQLARAGYMPEETYLLARHIWARYGYESNKRPQDLVTDALRLLAKYPVDPARYSAHSMARYQEYRHNPQQPQEAAPAALQRPQPARRAVCTPDDYLTALSGLDMGAGVVLAVRAERAQAAGVSVKTAQRIERHLQAASALRIELYTLAASDGRRTRASRVVLIPVGTPPAEGADVHTGIRMIAAEGADVHTGISMSGADVHTIIEEAAQGVDTPQSSIMSDNSAVCIGKYTVCDHPLPPAAPAAPAPAPAPAPAAAAGGRHTPPVSSPCPAPRPLAELVSDALDAYGTAGGKAARRRVITHVRTVGGLKVSEGAITRVYLAELSRRKYARVDAALRRTAEAMSPTKRRARLRSLERSIAADLTLAADLRVRPLTDAGEPRSEKTPAALTARAWVWAHQYAIIAQVHEERTQDSPAYEEAQLLAEAGAVIERLRAAGELPAPKPRASFKPQAAPAQDAPAPAAQVHQMDTGDRYDVSGMIRRLEERNRQLASCAD